MSTLIENQALQSCSACRKQKRKCSKELPVCLLCRRMRRSCHYPSENDRSSTAGSFRDLLQLTPSGSQPASNLCPFPALYFLDSYTFHQRGGIVQKPEIDLPAEYLECVGSDIEIENEIDLYFNSTHHFFPIIFKRRIYQQISSSPNRSNADLVLLLIAMKMHCGPIHSSASTDFYRRAKTCYSYVEAQNLFSVKTLQAALLIALYEIANAIYPAAYITVGHCARLGHAMGIHDRKNAPQMLQETGSWTEAEEMRRVWWGVIVLERYVNIGTGSLPFACDDPKPEDLLPADESCWERGEPTVIQSLAVSTSTSIAASPFSRTCQASHLLSIILRHINEKHTNAQYHYQQAIKIHHAIYAFSSAISHEIEECAKSSPESTSQVSLFTGMAICYSAQLTLYDMYTCAVADDRGGVGIPEQLEMQNIALVTIKEVCAAVHDFSNKVLEASNSDCVSRISPLVSECLYKAALNYSWYTRETGNDEFMETSVEIMSVLRILGRKWDIANEYLRILEGGE